MEPPRARVCPAVYVQLRWGGDVAGYLCAMEALQRFAVGIRLLVRRHSLSTWLLWLIVVAVLVATPFAFLDPASWVFALDPELAAIVVLLGATAVRSGALRLLRR